MLVFAVTLSIGKLIALIVGLLCLGGFGGFMICAMLSAGSRCDEQMEGFMSNQHPTSNIQIDKLLDMPLSPKTTDELHIRLTNNQ